MSRLAVIAVVAFALLTVVSPDAAEPRQITHNESGNYEAFPDVCRLDDGRILCLYYREFNKGAGSSIRQAIFRVKPGPTLEFEDQ